MGFPGVSVFKKKKKKKPTCNAGDTGLIPGRKDPLEKEVATHSSTLAWEILQTEEPDRLQSIGWRESWT